MSAATSAYGGLDPAVTAFSSFSGPLGPYGAGSVYADSELVYYFEVAGPSGGPVPVKLTALGHATTSDSAITDYASLDVVALPGTGTFSDIYNVAACVGQATGVCATTSSSSQQFSVSPTLQITPNQLYEIVIEANIEGGSFYGSIPSGAFTASADVDPTLQLDPSAAGQYHLLTSPNLAATPEPGGLVLVATGALVLVAFGYRARAIA